MHHSDVGGPLEKLYQTKEDARPSTHEGQINNYVGPQPHAVDTVTVTVGTTLTVALAYERDLNGNALTREYMEGSSKVTQNLAWNSANQLLSVTMPISESYWYDDGGIRTRKEQGAVNTLYPFSFYEVEGSTPTRYYLLNGRAIALRTGTGDVTYLHGDQVGSVVMTTVSNTVVQERQYFAYGTKRGGDEFDFEPDYMGQRKDDTGLLYYNARYYDPRLGQFISPETMIPDPTDYFSYNRYLYSRGNPLKYNDPSGHCPAPPEGMGATICMALFIQPESVPAGPFTVHAMEEVSIAIVIPLPLVVTSGLVLKQVKFSRI